MNQQSSLHVGFCPHSSIKFALQIDGTGWRKMERREKAGRGGEVATLNQKTRKRDVLDVGLSLFVGEKKMFLASSNGLRACLF